VGELVDIATERILTVALPADLRQLFINLLNRDGDASALVDDRLRRDYLPTLVGLMIASSQFQWH
ncbi:MAG TPA: hypothetical protein PLZ51_14445, partial [Aggregatilineales bacterium]|nr:hypothetical protein [Aggregatilineales bacterium]